MLCQKRKNPRSVGDMFSGLDGVMFSESSVRYHLYAPLIPKKCLAKSEKILVQWGGVFSVLVGVIFSESGVRYHLYAPVIPKKCLAKSEKILVQLGWCVFCFSRRYFFGIRRYISLICACDSEKNALPKTKKSSFSGVMSFLFWRRYFFGISLSYHLSQIGH
jgi:hypothetical protein